MIDALLQGKLTSRQENMEDILTSNVFGMLQYVPPERGLFPFLALARTPETHEKHCCPLKNLLGESYAVEYRFWPTWQDRQPDVELRIKSSDVDLYLIGIEAKYRSGKSSEAEADDVDQETECTDQLTCEWNELVHEAESWNSKPVLIYLTKDDGTLYSVNPKDDEEYWGKDWKGVARLNTFAHPLDEITSAGLLKEKVVQPLLEMLSKHGSQARNSPEE